MLCSECWLYSVGRLDVYVAFTVNVDCEAFTVLSSLLAFVIFFLLILVVADYNNRDGMFQVWLQLVCSCLIGQSHKHTLLNIRSLPYILGQASGTVFPTNPVQILNPLPNPLRLMFDLIFDFVTGIFSKWSSSSSTLRPSTVTAASRPRRKRTSSSAPLPPSSPRLNADHPRPTICRRTHWVTSHRGHCFSGLVPSGSCVGASFAVGSGVCRVGLFFCHCGGLGKDAGSFAGGFFRTRVYPAGIFVSRACGKIVPSSAFHGAFNSGALSVPSDSFLVCLLTAGWCLKF